MADIKLAPLSFREAIEFFRKKVPMTREQYEALVEDARAFAFAVSDITALSVLQDIYDEVARALEEGTTFQEFKQSLDDVAVRRGWEGLSPYRADNIFRTNLQTAYNVGRYKQMTDTAVVDRRPYWQYDAVNDRRTRPTHLALDGMVRRHEDPFWSTWYPPNGYRCRCSVRNLSARDVDRRGLTVGEGIPAMVTHQNGTGQPLIPDQGFDTNPAKSPWQPDITKFAEPLQKAFKEHSKTV